MKLAVQSLFMLYALSQVAPSFAAPATSSGSFPECASSNARSDAIKAAFLHAYDGYVKYAWGHDESLPKSKGADDTLSGWGATIFDAIDTMVIMGLDDLYDKALDFVLKTDFTKTKSGPAKGFETGIRYLGGLLSANDLRPNPGLVKKAVELTENVLLPLFSSPSGAPYTFMDVGSGPEKTSTINLAEFGTYSLEFTRLSQITGDDKYAKIANDLINRAMEQPTRLPGLYPTSWKVNDFTPDNSSIVTVGAGGDSFYEYLSKNYILLGGSNQKLMDTWVKSVNSIKTYLLSPTAENPNIKYVASINNSTVTYSSDELICFWPGNILLGMSQMNTDTSEFGEFAKTFMDSCMNIWENTATGLAPESWSWKPQKAATDGPLGKFSQGLKDAANALKKLGEKLGHLRRKRATADAPFTVETKYYDLRPETIESIFYFFRVTGDTKYQDDAWKIFQAIEKYTKTDYGYTMYNNVNSVDIAANQGDFQESFFFAETLKYLYLTFVDPSCMSLDDYVFNTEAHPFKLPKPITFQKTLS